jgi:hypothetical protein
MLRRVPEPRIVGAVESKPRSTVRKWVSLLPGRHRNIVRAGFRLESVRTNWESPYMGPSAKNGDRSVARS